MDLEEQLAKCEQERDEYLNGWKRAKADFINFQHEQEKVKREWMGFANQKILEQLLALYDSVSQGAKHELEIKQENGWAQVLQQFKAFLKSHGVEPIVVKMGGPPDHDYHEVVEAREMENTEPGVIIEEVQTGFLLKGKVLRVSKVVVSK